MNKKGKIIWWTVGILVIAFGIFFSSTAFAGQQKLVKGQWQTNFLKHNVLPAERDLLGIDAVARNIGIELASELTLSGGYAADMESPCGVVFQRNLWNKGETACFPPIKDTFSKKAAVKLRQRFPTRMYGDTGTLDISFFGIGGMEKVETKYGVYQFNTSFSVPLGYSFDEYALLRDEAIELLASCREEIVLEKCLREQRRPHWRFSTCDKEVFQEEQRKVPFCVRSPASYKIIGEGEQEKLVEYFFALDFARVDVESDSISFNT